MERANVLSQPIVQVTVLSFFIGGIAGYGMRILHEHALGNSSPTIAAAAPGGGGGGMGGGGRMGGGGMGGGAASGPRNDAALARLVRTLDTIQKAQGKGLAPQQARSIVPILTALKSAEKIPDKEAEAQVTRINAILTGDQKKAVQDMQPAGRGGGAGGAGGGRGGAGGGRGAAGGGAGQAGSYPGGGAGRPGAPGGGTGGPGAPGGAPGGGAPGGGMGRPGAPGGGGAGGGMMGASDPEKPFGTDRSRAPLDDLLTLAQSASK